MKTPPDSDPTQMPPPLSRNLLSIVGWLVTLTLATVLVVLVGMDMITHRENAYSSLVTYLVLPGFLMGGVSLILLGIGLEWRRRHLRNPGEYPILPVIDINHPWQRRRVMIGMILISMLVTFSGIGIYQAYHFSESPAFCGQICHQVMKPEFTAYQHSPHARVACVQCHIGPGAEWFVKAKLSGLRQVWAVLTKSYHLPIKTPVSNLRPARGTCEQCHWPAQFMDSVEKVIWHFSPDEVNTPIRYNLLLKVGGGSSDLGQSRGIHWHISPGVTVRYWARDEQRLDIPWVEIRDNDGEPKVYKTEDCPDPLPEDAKIRLMDCIDCHNRPSHIYRSPRQLVDNAMAHGALDRSLPFLKRRASDLMEQRWPDTPTALDSIRNQMEIQYASWMQGERGQQVVDKNIQLLQTLYTQNFFPEQQVDWRAYPDHRGHFEWPGCYRCHDGKHVTAEAAPIGDDCNMCHEILDQAEGEAAFGPLTYKGGPFRHPRNLGDIWQDRQCTQCHGLQAGQSAEEIVAHNATGKATTP